ncbi:MAG TPA: tRNA epoxyqueuosine(34) reductase QueG, partial [Gammaproteobacteria bacterium]|nr:tRNA epoxyqueuosine(34) reductase QueG [Gammaproteobacteria bacterium]
MSLQDLKNQIPQWAEALGFSATGFVKLDRSDHEAHLLRWLRRDNHGSMDYMARNVDLR